MPAGPNVPKDLFWASRLYGVNGGLKFCYECEHWWGYGDGFRDYALGYSGASSATGKVFLLFMASTGVSVKSSTVLTSGIANLPGISQDFGMGVLFGGDINLDGIPDIVCGTPSVPAAYIIFLSSAGASKSYAALTSGSTGFTTTVRGTGTRVSLGPDLNGDGIL